MKTKFSLGEKIINEVIKQGMFTVGHPDPQTPHVFVWSANAAEQLEAVVANHIKHEKDTP